MIRTTIVSAMLFCCDIREFCELMLSKSRNVLKNTLLQEQWQYRKSGYKIVGQLYETLSIEQCSTNRAYILRYSEDSYP